MFFLYFATLCLSLALPQLRLTICVIRVRPSLLQSSLTQVDVEWIQEADSHFSEKKQAHHSITSLSHNGGNFCTFRISCKTVEQ